jgi:Brp/Blh family beta-carotene 15,15'-monooxygenase
LISVYHFGQSNWEEFKAPFWVKTMVNVVWGAFVLGGSVLWHWDESSLIIAQLVPSLPAWSVQTMFNIQILLLGINVFIIGGLRLMGYINQERLLLESFKLAILGFMLYFTPLLVGFTIYFTLWHSLGSLLSQVAFFRKQWPSFTILQYYRQATPFTLLALLGLFGMVLSQPYLFPNISLLSVFMVFTSCITLPHIFLIEESYK